MSVKSTHYVTKEFSKEAIKLLVEKANDEQLSDALEILLGDDFKNFTIVSQEELEKEKANGWAFCLDNINQLFNR